MPWVDIVILITEMMSSNCIAQDTRSQAANGKNWEIWNLQDLATCLLHCQNLMKYVEHSDTSTNSPTTTGTTKKHFDFFLFD